MQPITEMKNVFEVSNQLKENLTLMKRLLGDQWESESNHYRAILLAVMAANGETNPFRYAIPMAKQMSERGHSPLMLLAVSTEICTGTKNDL